MYSLYGECVQRLTLTNLESAKTSAELDWEG
jgi:hypothetical protein